MRICPVSGSEKWLPFYTSVTDKIMTGDQRICDGSLEKIICPDSGIVANKNPFSEGDLEVLYGKEYELNTLGKEEHFFYTKDGAIARSEVFFQWIKPHLQVEFNSLIEIGCGEGNLLERFTREYPDKNIIGIDGSSKASELAKKKGLKVQQKLIFGNEELPLTDVFLLVNVIEHVENIPLLISTLKKSLKKNGRIIFCLPIQDYGGYDIFFNEHVWHFTSQHFENILRNNGLEIIFSDVNHSINHGIGLFVCEMTDRQDEIVSIYTDLIKNNLLFWEEKFKNINFLLKENSFEKIVIFGAGEVATLFLTFTDLSKQNIIACIDDTKEIGSQKHGIPVYHSEWLEENPVDFLLLTVNNKYHKMIIEKFSHLTINIQPIY